MKKEFHATIAVALGFVLLPGAVHAVPGDTTVVSLSAARSAVPGDFGPGGKPHQSISADGRYVVFETNAALVASDTNGVSDIYLRDRTLGVTRRVSVAVDGSAPDRESHAPAISANGRYVAFESSASNLVPNDTNGGTDIFVRDMVARTTERVSVTATGAQVASFIPGDLPSVSADGRYVAFISTAALVPGDDTSYYGSYDIYVRDRELQTTLRVTIRSDGKAPNGISGLPTISDDGRFVAFSSEASNLIAGDVNNIADVFVRDMQTGAFERVSVGSGADTDWGYLGSISGNGRYVVFWTTAALDPSDTNGRYDIYVRDRSLRTTERVSVSSSGALAKRDSYEPAISQDGRFVTFESDSINLVSGDTNRVRDVFVRDRSNGTTERASIATSGLEGNGPSMMPSVAADGTVTFMSGSTNLGSKTPGAVYVHEPGGPKIKSYRLQPVSLAFGPQPIGTGRTLTLKVVNTGTVPIWVASLVLLGPNATDFRISNVCHGWVQPTLGCGTKVTFKPATVGNKIATFQVTAADNVVQSATLTGTGQ
jgi:Tol biopolymer transport system component